MTGHGLVVVSLESWDDVWRRNQYLVAALLRADPDLRVLFVEPPADVTHAATHRRLPRLGRGLRRGPLLTGVEGDRLWLYQPMKPLPRRLDPGFDRRRARFIVRAARRAGVGNPVLWINDIGGAALLDESPAPALYDVTDDWLAADRPTAELERLSVAEARLLAECEEVTVCSPALLKSKGSERAVSLVTNAVDLDRYRTAATRPDDLPPGPTAVYVGTLHTDRLDVDTCVAAAAALGPDGTLVLVGPDALEELDSARLRAAGVVVLGARPFDTVPGYLQHADVLVVPHIVDGFTDSLDPIKLYEYLAVGRTVVSTPVAGFRDLALDHVSVVEPREFAAAVAQAARSSAGPFPVPDDLPTWDGQSVLMRAAIDRARQHHATPPSRPRQ